MPLCFFQNKTQMHLQLYQMQLFLRLDPASSGSAIPSFGISTNMEFLEVNENMGLD